MIYPSLASESLVDVVRMIRTPNVGPVTFFQLRMRYGSVGEALAEIPNISIRGGRKQAVKPFSKTEAEDEIAKVTKYGAKLIVYGDADYPKHLLHVYDAPPLLAVNGNTASYKEKPLVAFVGSRNASANGCQFAQKLAKECAAAGIVVVSGLARGIDSFAHKGALAGGTVAVIAGGIDNIYPPENTVLYNEIIEHGAIISEQPFGQIPFAGAFPSRNRIIAGMSLGTVIIEASPKSGSLITARLAGDYNRDVFAVPGSPLDPRAKGCIQLIKQGAIVVEEASDIISVIAQTSQRQFSETQMASYVAGSVSDNDIQTARATVFAKLGVAATSVDELIEQCALPSGVVQAVLLELELAGKVTRNVGNKVSLVADVEQANQA